MSSISSNLGLFQASIRDMNQLGSRHGMKGTDHLDTRKNYADRLQNLALEILGNQSPYLKTDTHLRFAELIFFKGGLSQDQIEGEDIFNLAKSVVTTHRFLEIKALSAMTNSDVRESLAVFLESYKTFAIGFSEALLRRIH